MRSTTLYAEKPELYDKWFIFAALAIVAMGLIMMTSASIVVSDKQLHQPFHFLFKQLVFLTLGIFVGGLILQVEIGFWKKNGGYFLLLVMLLLALVLIPGIGHRVNGSARWMV